jgi:hypothetical protein
MRVITAALDFLTLPIKVRSVPTPTIINSKLAFLTSPAGASLLSQVMVDPREDLQLASASWMREAGPQARAALLQQRALRIKAKRKHSRAAEMLFTPLGFQQLTPEPLARYKARRLPEGIRVLADFCCGLGGDSLHVASTVSLIGVDTSWDTLLAYKHNVGLFRETLATQADVNHFHPRVDGILLDPARRSLSQGARDFDAEPEPGWEEIVTLVARFRNAVIKLGPGAKLPESLVEEEREFLGWHDECLELTVRTGVFGKPGLVRAVELPGETSVEALAAD